MLRRNLHRSPQELKTMQMKMLHAILEHSYQNVSFYHRKFRSANVKPDDIKKTEDLTKIPTTTKKELQSTPLNEILAKSVDISKCRKTLTSGSTGIPLAIVADSRTAYFYEALWARACFENGLKLLDKMVVIRDPHNFPAKRKWLHRLNVIRRKHVSVFDDGEMQLRFLEKYKPDALRGYPSAMAILASLCRQRTCSFKPRLAFTGSEILDGETRKLIGSVFNSEVFDNYGCMEFSLLAWECREHKGYHVNVDNIVMELIQNNEVVSPGERGEVVCTGLANYVMPFIRYRLDDVCVSNEELCPCGLKLPLIETLEGRTDDFLVTLDGRLISPMAFFPYPFEENGIEGIDQFRVVQEKKDKLTFQLVPNERFSSNPRYLENAKEEIRRLFGEDMQVEFQLLKELGKGSGGKLRKIVRLFPLNM
jgi:phenylacetate-CoA ligase